MSETAAFEIVSLTEARDRKLTKYFTGKPCCHGHVAQRYARSQTCFECRRVYYRGRPELKEQKRLAYWKEGGREKRRERNLVAKYGITSQRYEAMRVLQNDCCGLCGATLEQRPTKRLVVDHDHRTDQIRELLCTTCNLGLGAFGDDPAKLKKAIKYLKRHGRS